MAPLRRPKKRTESSAVREALARFESAKTKDESEDRLDDLARIAGDHVSEILDLYSRGSRSAFALVWCLQGVREPRVVEFFESALRDRDAFIRWAAAEGLKHCEDERLIPVFCRALRDRAHLVKAVAVEWLGTHGDDRAIAPLERLFELRSLEKSAPGLLTAAARSISSIRARVSS